MQYHGMHVQLEGSGVLASQTGAPRAAVERLEGPRSKLHSITSGCDPRVSGLCMLGLLPLLRNGDSCPNFPVKWGNTCEGLSTTPRAASAQWGFLCHPGHPSLALGCTGDRGREKACPRGLTRMFLRQGSLQGRGSEAEEQGGRDGTACGLQAPTFQPSVGPAASATGLRCRMQGDRSLMQL